MTSPYSDTGRVDVSAQPRDTIYFTVYYYNIEDPDSHRIAENVRVQVTAPANASSDCRWKFRVWADNSNTVRNSVCLHLPKGAIADRQIGFVTWRHNVSEWSNGLDWKSETISDDVVGKGARIDNAPPCGYCWGFVDFRVVVYVPSRTNGA
jgi:hypothetical protein